MNGSGSPHSESAASSSLALPAITPSITLIPIKQVKYFTYYILISLHLQRYLVCKLWMLLSNLQNHHVLHKMLWI